LVDSYKATIMIPTARILTCHQPNRMALLVGLDHNNNRRYALRLCALKARKNFRLD